MTESQHDDRRHHVRSLLMRESLLDKEVMSSTETPVVRMLPDCHVIMIGGRSIIDGGKVTTYPLVEAIGAALTERKLIIGTGGGVRSRRDRSHRHSRAHHREVTSSGKSSAPSCPLQRASNT